MAWKRLVKALLYPHIAVMLALVPIAIALLIYAMAVLGSDSVVAILAYVLAAYTLTVWCLKIPYLIRFFKAFKRENKYVQRWLCDERLRVNVSLYGSLFWNTAYAVFQLAIGIYHGSFWFCSLAVYYICLAAMRFFLLRHTARYRAGEQMRAELLRYRACAIWFLLLNLVLSVLVFFMVYFNRTFVHHEITTIAMAAYTFTTFTAAIVGMVKYRKYNSPVYSASKTISFTAGCVSMLTLESTMLNTFGATREGFRRMMLALTGAAIAAILIFLGAYMIVTATKKLKEIESEGNGAE
ncbi:MAG: hypothetical protein J6B09_05010 [Clostridia bacterium]|nr:hypothetical protein [Clostridia bacterium]